MPCSEPQALPDRELIDLLNEAAGLREFMLLNRAKSVNELARAVAQAMGVSPQFDYLPARHETLSAYSNHEKVARVFGRRPGHTLALGLERMAAWAKHHGPRQSSVFDDIEVTKNFPAGWLTAK